MGGYRRVILVLYAKVDSGNKQINCTVTVLNQTVRWKRGLAEPLLRSTLGRTKAQLDELMHLIRWLTEDANVCKYGALSAALVDS